MKLANYRLILDENGNRDLEDTFCAYAGMRDILDIQTPSSRTDTFELQRLAYEQVRSQTGLPARLVTNGIREYAAGLWSANRLPLDEKLMSFKGVDSVSLATVHGRMIASFLVTGYRETPDKGSLSHLIHQDGTYSLSVPLSREMQNKEIDDMQTESISGRVSRLAAGLVATVIDSLERKAPEAVAEQAIREIDKASDELKSGLAAVIAERKRYAMQRTDLLEEHTGLDSNIRVALRSGREDLARAGIGRQDDINAQVASIDRLIDDVDIRISDSKAALNAAAAARRDAEERVKIARRASQHQAQGQGPASTIRHPSPEDRIAAALSAVGRLTDLPAGTTRSEDLAELEAFGRDRRIDDRLAVMRKEIEDKE